METTTYAPVARVIHRRPLAKVVLGRANIPERRRSLAQGRMDMDATAAGIQNIYAAASGTAAFSGFALASTAPDFDESGGGLGGMVLGDTPLGG